MDNLLLLLVFLVTINIWITRNKAIKKVEHAKIKRAQQNESNLIQHKDIQTVQSEIPFTNQKKKYNKKSLTKKILMKMLLRRLLVGEKTISRIIQI